MLVLEARHFFSFYTREASDLVFSVSRNSSVCFSGAPRKLHLCKCTPTIISDLSIINSIVVVVDIV